MVVLLSKYYILFTVLLIRRVVNHSIYVAPAGYEEKGSNYKSHLQYKSIVNACSNRNIICTSNEPNLCAVRITREKNETSYRDYINICYLFLSNMCDLPGEEYYAIQTGTCDQYLRSRRHVVLPTEKTSTAGESTTRTSEGSPDGNILRNSSEAPKFVTLYPVGLVAHDGHACPFSCTQVYSPVCIVANRGFGKYLKMMHFVNHCASDLYYCYHWEEFAAPTLEPDGDPAPEMIDVSPLSWSHCGSNRYIQLARFAESASALGHFGWLAGDYKFTHILSPEQKMPGYG